MPTINAPGRWDVFISHSQRDANATTLAEGIFASLKERGLDVWLDVKMNKRDVAAMEEGAKNATMVIAIVTDGGIIRVDKDDVDTAFFRRDFCLEEMRWAKSAGAAIQPVIRVEDKKRVGEFIASAPDDLKDIGKVDWVDLNRGAVQYWNVGMDILVQRLEEARKRVRQPAEEAAGKNGMHADALALLKEMHLDKYADALFKEGVVTAADLSLVDDEIMDDVGFSKLEKKKFLKHRPSSARPSSLRAPESGISTVRRGQAAMDSFKARGNWRKLANVRDAATRLHMLSVDAKAKTSTSSSKAAIESIKEAEGRNNVNAIIETMKLNVADADVQEQACWALRNMSADNSENDSRIGQAGGIEAVVEAMKRHQDHAGVQEYACWALRNLSNHDENRTRIGKMGGIEALVEAMKRHKNHADVQENACRAFVDLSRNHPENKSRIAQAGGIEAVLRAMKRHQDHANVQEYACWALRNLSNHDENRTRIGQMGGIEALLSAMKGHQDHAGVQESACGALSVLSSDNPENQSRIGQAGGIEALLSAMKRHENHADVQEYACIVFYFISFNAERKRRAIDAGAIPAIEAARRNHPNNDEVQTEAADALGQLRS